jgi:hypothetical protein
MSVSKIIKMCVPLIVLLTACTRGPEPPQLIYPEDEGALFNSPFVWSSVPEAAEYNFQIARDNSFSEPLRDKTLTDTTYLVTNTEIFEPNVTYYWHVYSGDGANWGPSSEIRSFTIATGGKP